MTTRTAILGSPDEQPEDNEKLLELFRNRAELKKEFAAVREEQFQLQERVKERDGAVARLQQKLDHLESLLLDPEWVHNVIVFFQLRNLGLRCSRKLAKFAEQLKQQRELRQHGQVLADWDEQLGAECSAVERQIGEVRMQVQLLEDRLQAERHRASTMNGISKLVSGRKVQSTLEELAVQIDAAQRQEDSFLQQLEQVQNRPAPDTPGLELAEKRSINFMIIAFAQQLFLDFGGTNLASLTKEANDKSVGAINYGDKSDCDVILARVEEHSEVLEKGGEFADILQRRAKLIAEKAMYREDNDAVPVPGTVARIFAIDESGNVVETDTNLLGENYWDLANVLSR